MRPHRTNIAAPELPPRTRWIGEGPASMSQATAQGPVLVHFLEVTQRGSLNVLAHLIEWERRYGRRGLTVLGVHSPRFSFTADRELLASELERLGVRHPVAADLDHAIWRDYDPGGWPALFLWNQGGALRWAHFGEGAYPETEREIEAALAGDPVAIVDPVAASETANGAPAPLVSPELFPGGSASEPTTQIVEVSYEGGSVDVVLDGGGRVGFAIDGGEVSELVPSHPGLHRLAEHPGGTHTLLIEPRDGARIWSLSFAP